MKTNFAATARTTTGNHPGIRIDSINPEGAIGALFVLGTVLIFTAIPAVRGFLAISVPLGILGSMLRMWWINRT